ncbi:MAG: cobalamin biosynthesis protein, partial [Paracoccaceae bacterium]
RISQEPWVNAGAPDPDATALAAGLALYRRTMQACAVLLFGLAALCVF